MATYPEYVGAISGKSFSSQYLYTAVNGTDMPVTNGTPNVGYSGSASTYQNGIGVSGQVSTIDAAKGTFKLADRDFQVHGSSEDGQYLFFRPIDGGRLYVLSNNGTPPSGTINFSTSNPYNAPAPVCFVTGTRIATAHGEVPIEQLMLGDLILVEDGRLLPLRWLGHRHVTCSGNPWRQQVAPIRIEAGAIAPGCPARDLLLSPGHCLALGDTWLVWADSLVNGTTIRRDEGFESVTYWHVELDEHAVIFAEGLAVESFIDVGNKESFDNGSGCTLTPEEIAAALARYCRPVAKDRDILAELRSPIDERARRIAWAASLFPEYS